MREGAAELPWQKGQWLAVAIRCSVCMAALQVGGVLMLLQRSMLPAVSSHSDGVAA
jgi:hypothetical protein